ncbi:hypothetical protein [Chamaesiphon sp. OTE_75_metabat_556]|uniref:hypothetical protein n=1 Tax=Chamaesiphon sp. OTE_75_metabat_556 TaxID=2964692 RepID=UPI00286BC954|nr:hypothetical protein [Chamaesiphon sp. OTE_75_metabat_556]
MNYPYLSLSNPTDNANPESYLTEQAGIPLPRGNGATRDSKATGRVPRPAA